MTAGQQTGTNPDAISIHLAEYASLRQEIDNRTRLANQLVFSQLTVLGAGMAVFDVDKVFLQDVLLGLAAISACLWLFWLDHLRQVFKIGAYIGLRLAPILQGFDARALGWEKFLREIDSDEHRAGIAIFGDPAGRSIRFGKTRSIGANTTLLFGAITPVLIAVYLSAYMEPILTGGLAGADTIRVVAVLATVGVWGAAVRQALQLRRTMDAISDAVLNLGPGRADD